MNPGSESGRDWASISSAPEGIAVLTKIDDELGVRNIQPLVLVNRLWYYPDKSMYVYYRPTHWSPL
jgi:hypothetical protein